MCSLQLRSLRTACPLEQSLWPELTDIAAGTCLGGTTCLQLYVGSLMPSKWHVEFVNAIGISGSTCECCNELF